MEKTHLPLDPDLATEREAPVDPETGEPLDCTRCGACCEAGPGNIPLTEDDLVLWRRAGRQDLAERVDEGHFGMMAFPTTHEGACIYFTRPEGRSICSIYAERASTCREFQAGSWQCLEFRRDARKKGRLGRSKG
ncbi:YkgJ family cysteine cluster protein [Polyangium fumosum]|nr:YkgJ family cysteine cluster protein [Polyangium fumosum]